VLSFFSVGFLAGSFEQAAGLGAPEQREPQPTYAVDLAPRRLPSAIDLAAPSLDSWRRLSTPGQHNAGVDAPAPRAHAVAVVPTRPLIEAGDAQAAEWAQTRSRGSGAKAETAALHQPTPELAPPPGPKLRPFFAPVQPEDDAAPTLLVPEPKPARRPPEFILPMAKGRVTSMFNQGRRHPAIDLAAPLGSPVYATTRKQRVSFAGWRGGYGNLVITTDPQGRQHYYGHLHRILARVGSLLEQGDVLGLLGSTGRSTGPHVHYEVRTARRGHLDPSKLLFAFNVRRGYAWAHPAPEASAARLARAGQGAGQRRGQPRPR
jgi:murein DD-endopeptidase MepM/ murein hydrolase activator NlpD